MSGYQSDINLKALNFEGDLPVENTLGGFAITTGNANHYLLNLSSPLTGYRIGLSLQVKFHVANTDPVVSLNVDGLGFVLIKKVVGNELVDVRVDELGTDPIYDLIYDGTYFQVGINSSTTVATAPSTDGTLVLKGFLNGSQFPSFPQATRGDCYIVSGDGEIGNGDFSSGLIVYRGDLVYANSGNAGGDYEDLSNDWSMLSGGRVSRPD